MNYFSTRDTRRELGVCAAQAIKQGLASDGGLFVPETLPTLTREFLDELCRDDYATRAAKVMKLFLEDYTYEELLEDCQKAYAPDSFRGGAAPLVKVEDGLYSLELWHGPTAAFKDMALQIMPRLLSRALKKTGEERTALILVATSGDTGKAALEGYRDIDQIKMIVFYPVDGVSRVQKLQMAIQLGDNVRVLAIRGNFDDAQTGVKRIFGDAEVAARLDDNGYLLSSANSINWGRLLPQIVYYVSAWCDLTTKGELSEGETFNVCVPTGNFGNIFAAYLARRMGLPIGKLICASNENHVLTDFLRTGTYDRNRPFHLTMSPSMDILISSNLERLLYFTAGSEATADYMAQLNKNGCYTVDSATKAEIDKVFLGYYADETDTAATIEKIWKKDHYLSDTHTSVALACAEKYMSETGDKAPMVVASTASPYKFANNVYRAVAGKEPTDELAALDELSALTGVEITYPLAGLASRPVRFKDVIDTEGMTASVYETLGL
ncbi:MAG: threonine synthase [Clostridia bacterium]|nr:threonine synthase [Clostridia bacterium]